MSIRSFGRIKQFLENHIDHALGSLIGSRISAVPMQPRDIERKVLEAIDGGCTVFENLYYLPNVISIELNPENKKKFENFWNIFLHELQEAVKLHIEQNHNTARNLGEAVRIDILENMEIPSGQVRVAVELIAS
jgi:hypothetical protein